MRKKGMDNQITSLMQCVDTDKNFIYIHKDRLENTIYRLFESGNKYVWINILGNSTKKLPIRDIGFDNIESALTHILDIFHNCDIFEFHTKEEFIKYLKTL